MVNGKVFSFLLKAGVLLIARISVGRMFQAVGPATLNVYLPNFSDVREMTEQGVIVG